MYSSRGPSWTAGPSKPTLSRAGKVQGRAGVGIPLICPVHERVLISLEQGLSCDDVDEDLEHEQHNEQKSDGLSGKS